MHNDTLYPVHGKYICAECLREWPVPWAAGTTGEQAAMKPQPQANVSSDVMVTSPERGLFLIRLPIRSFRSAPDARMASRT